MTRRLLVGVAGGLYHLSACLDTSDFSRRRRDAARAKLKSDRKLAYDRDQVEKTYLAKIAESQT